MVADNDKGGVGDDEYTPEFTGSELPPEEPTASVEPTSGFDSQDVVEAPQASSPLKKAVTVLLLIGATVGVAFFLMHQKNARVAAQSEAAGVVKTSVPSVDKADGNDAKSSAADKTSSLAESANTLVAASIDANTPSATNESTTDNSTSESALVVVQPDNKAQAAEKKPVPAVEAKSAPATVAKSPEGTAEVTQAQEAKSTEAKAAEATAPVAQVAATSSPEVKTADATSAPAAVTVDSSAVTAQIGVLKEQGKATDEKINDLKTRVVRLDSSLSSISASLASLEKKLSERKSATPLKASEMKVAEVKVPRSKDVTTAHSSSAHPAKVVAPSRPKVAVALSKAPVSVNSAGASVSAKVAYVVRAIVPGRAWLESPTGYTFSVTVGDRVLGFGVVSQIDSEHGEVNFDGGDVIKYGSDDH